MANRTKITPKKRQRFLAALAGGHTVTHAAASINVAREHMYRLRADDEQFAGDWNAAIEAGTEVLEQEARRRAVDGWDEPITHLGVVTGVQRRYSDVLLIFLLKGRKPLTYRDNSTVKHEGSAEAPLRIIIEE